jgi:hypothetical protein
MSRVLDIHAGMGTTQRQGHLDERWAPDKAKGRLKQRVELKSQGKVEKAEGAS